MARDTLLRERQQLRSLLEEYPDEAKTLPNLVEDTSQSWMEPFDQQVQEWLESFWKWLREVTGPLPPIDIEADWTSWLPILMWITIALILFGLIYSLSKKLDWPHTGQASGGEGRSSGGEETRLSNILAAAISEDNWALAARIRWRMFLSRMQCQTHVTPHEFFAETHHREQWKQLEGIPIHEQYEVMFASSHVSSQWFNAYHHRLSQLEQGDTKHG